MKRFFASDNYSGVHPKIMKAIMEENSGHEFAYGEDKSTKKAQQIFKEIFGDVDVYFVYNGTGANVIALEACKKKGDSVICSDVAHIFTDEAGAPSKITGMSLLPVSNIDGKIDLKGVERYLTYKNSHHRTNPKILSITQATELGTMYSLEELKEIGNFKNKNEMLLHMDGARIANAAVSLGVSLKEMTADVGVDILSFGGTKNGLMFGEVIVVFNKTLSEEFFRMRKQNLQLNSKMRFQSVQYIEYFKDNLWYENAKNSNEMARYFAEELEKIEIEVTNKVMGNTIFAMFPKEILKEMQEYCYFYVWDELTGEIRLVTSFDTEKKDIDSFIKKLKELI
ncbi:MAG: threonine aldolase family protein [Fusobacteriaceae bacterium]